MKLHLITAGLTGLLLAACATSAPTEDPQTEVSVADTTTQFSEAGLDALEARMKQYVSDGHVYGIHTRLVQGDAVVSDVQYGLRDVIEKKPIEEDTIYRIYSMTKPITGVAMMQLYEQGKWKLDDPVTKFIPEYADLRVLAGQTETGAWRLVPADRPPTMAEVMSHTAGFAYGLFGDDPANSAFRDQRLLYAPDLQTFIKQTADVPLLFQPGERWSYSAAVDVQSAIVERISGQSYGEYLQEHIFAPLGMKDTGFYVPAEDYGRFSQVFGYNPENGQLVPLPGERLEYKKETIAMESGGGGLVSTMDDYTAFAQMLLNGGELNGARILKEETIELMRTNILPEGLTVSTGGNTQSRSPAGLGFGLDFGVIMDPSVREAAYGQGSYFWGGAAGTWFWVDPENDLFFVGMIQRFPRGGPEGGDLRGTSAQLVYEALDE